MYQPRPVHRCNSFFRLNAACPGKKYRESGASGFVAVANSSGTAPIALQIFDARNTRVFLLAIVSNRFARRNRHVYVQVFLFKFEFQAQYFVSLNYRSSFTRAARNKDTLDAARRSLPRVLLSSSASIQDNALAIVTATVNALRTRFSRKSPVKLRSSCVVSFRQKTVHRSAVVGRLARVG